MSAILPVVLLAVAGICVGGAISVSRQGGSKGVVGFLAVLGALAAAGGVLWLVPDG
jgi:hypothetical protein